MSSSPEDDSRLTEFLRHHRPPVPPADSGLEDRIVAVIEAVPLASPGQRSRSRQLVWLVPSAIAAGLIATISHYSIFSPTRQPNAAELAELETFIESTWSGTVAEQPSSGSEELLPLTDEPAVN